jgi:hypothetical protein
MGSYDYERIPVGTKARFHPPSRPSPTEGGEGVEICIPPTKGGGEIWRWDRPWYESLPVPPKADDWQPCRR